MQGTENRTKTLVILILAVIIGVIYLLSLFLAYPEFQDTRLIDPLAEINSLFPLYYLAIALTALLGLGCLIWRIENKYLHILLLLMFAVMLWFTPFYLAGFVRNLDGPWHVGVAMQMPQVLGGDPVAFSSYALTYPGSFIYHYTFLEIIDIEPTSYINILFPLLFVLLFVLLCYLFISRIFDKKVALLSMLIAIPGLHYIEMHPSPHAVASLLMLTALLLLARRGATAKIIAVVAIIAIIIISHPLTPPILSIFLAAALLTTIGYSRRFGRTQVALAGMLIFCLGGWFVWYVFYPAGPWEERLGGFLDLVRMLWELESSRAIVLGEPFMYGNIHNLNIAIYCLYAAAAVVGIGYIGARTYSQEKSIKNLVSKLGGLHPGEAFMALSVPLLLVLTFLLAEQNPVLVERGLTFVILALSCIIASVIVRSYPFRIIRKRIVHSVVIIGVLFLTLSSPIVAYSIDAFNSFPVSEGAGLEFLATEVPLQEKLMAIYGAHQLVLYAESSLSERCGYLSPPGEPVDFAKIKPDLMVFRRTGYYYAAMRRDLSFEDNRYIEYRAWVESNKYDKIYSSPTFEVYEKYEK